MKIAAIIVRTLIGLLLLFASISYFAHYMPEQPEMSDNMKTFNEGIGASGYMMPFVKVIELLCGLLFVSGRYVTLANILILPITLNIFLIHLFMGPENLLIASLLLLGNLFLIYRYWNNYRTVFAAT